MSTTSTVEEDRKCRHAQERLADIQARITHRWEWMQELRDELVNLRKQTPTTSQETNDITQAISFKERQLNEFQRDVNYLTLRARLLSQALA